MLKMLGFIEGVGFATSLFASLLAGVAITEAYYEKQADKEDKDESIQDAEVDEI